MRPCAHIIGDGNDGPERCVAGSRVTLIAGASLPRHLHLSSVINHLRPNHDMVEEGKPAPDFTAQTDSGTSLELKALRGKPVVLYFYPKDDTPG